MPAISGDKLRFEWDLKYAQTAKICDAVKHWDLKLLVIETDETTTKDLDGNETFETLPVYLLKISASFRGFKFGDAEIFTSADSQMSWERALRKNTGAIEKAVKMGRNNFQGLVNAAMWQHGITPEPPQ